HVQQRNMKKALEALNSVDEILAYKVGQES
ncbi:DUF4376 domain-containing protein, partial [Escherichia coli]